MPAYSSPHEIARESLRRMAARREPPTPHNYRKAYAEVTGGHPGADDVPVPASGLELLRTLTRQLDACPPEGTPAEKKQNIEKILRQSIGDSDPEKVYATLNRLMRQWSRLQSASDAASSAADSPVAGASGVASDLVDTLANLVAQAVERAISSLHATSPELLAEARDLAQKLRAARDSATVSALAAPLKQLWYKAGLRADDDDHLRQGLVRVLSLLIENVQEITTDDKWLNGQMTAVRKIISGPIDLEAIELVERSLRETIVRQGILRHSLSEARDRVKEMVGMFISRVSELSSMTGDYHDKIDTLAGKLRQTEDINELGTLLDEIMQATRHIQSQADRSRDMLTEARQQVELAEQRIRQLEAELVQAGEKVREDQLTGTLNRHGLDEVFDREISILQRNSQSLAVALLDIDNFKLLNDTYGHQAGDSALKHLANLIRNTIRPTDSVARLGGEEFLIVLPNSTVDESVAILQRLQRHLTKHFFLHDNQNLIITFSAGVTVHIPDEPRSALIARADKAMYAAKAAGKNRVVAA